MKTLVADSQKSKAKSTVLQNASYLKDLFLEGSKGISGKGNASGIGAILTNTAFKGLPAPLRLLAPIVVEKVIIKHGVPHGRELLLKGLRWVKKATDEKPVVKR
ncbi:hypothetical protein FEM33_10925 [Dyadobacter flavalbus]|uniref:Uncharacterized protein n=1 Tax=Dyadobacter flavalbus TaxID=2579942 RepID=A0A5M8QZ66_9BACT|nr:hypothetical protein [Dyadobacter flavalbus]KAA6439703.1 hypothetical protein FEM33_10925 [Dyadobacter flavalbus]